MESNNPNKKREDAELKLWILISRILSLLSASTKIVSHDMVDDFSGFSESLIAVLHLNRNEYGNESSLILEEFDTLLQDRVRYLKTKFLQLRKKLMNLKREYKNKGKSESINDSIRDAIRTTQEEIRNVIEAHNKLKEVVGKRKAFFEEPV